MSFDYRVKNIANFAHRIFGILLDKDDIFSLKNAESLLKSYRFVYDNTTAYFSEITASALIYIAVNLGNLVYQYAYASWVLYFLTSKSGLKKLYKVVFQNPILGIFFFSSFYFRLLTGTADEENFNRIVKTFKLPKHADFAGQKFLTSLVNNIPEKLLGQDISGYKLATKQVLKSVLGILIAAQVEETPVKLERVLSTSILISDKVKSISKSAVYVAENDIFKADELRKYEDAVLQNKNKIKREIGGRGGKRRRKWKLQQIIEKRTDTGEVICLDDCKDRTKTRAGCYCESDCGKSFVFGGKSWCYVDPAKCKRGRYLPKNFWGRSFDYCDESKPKTKNCYTGVRWMDCH